MAEEVVHAAHPAAATGEYEAGVLRLATVLPQGGDPGVARQRTFQSASARRLATVTSTGRWTQIVAGVGGPHRTHLRL